VRRISRSRRDELGDRRAYLLLRQQREALALGTQLNAGYVDARTAVRQAEHQGAGHREQPRRAPVKVFQGQIKQIKEFAEQQKDAYDFANKYLKGSYDDGLLALDVLRGAEAAARRQRAGRARLDRQGNRRRQ
jgi:hypothetical protein